MVWSRRGRRQKRCEIICTENRKRERERKRGAWEYIVWGKLWGRHWEREREWLIGMYTEYAQMIVNNTHFYVIYYTRYASETLTHIYNIYYTIRNVWCYLFEVTAERAMKTVRTLFALLLSSVRDKKKSVFVLGICNMLSLRADSRTIRLVCVRFMEFLVLPLKVVLGT